MNTPKNKEWQELRDNIDILKVLDLIKRPRPISRSRRGMDYKISYGDRRNAKEGKVGEYRIERLLLKTKQIMLINDAEEMLTKVNIVMNAVPLGAKVDQKREVDILGIDTVGSPVAIEVKDKANDAWYATVELCEYVWRMRHDPGGFEKNIQKLKNDNKKHRGAWGLLLAPQKWWENQEHSNKKAFESHMKLIKELAVSSEIRICSGIFSKDNPEIVRFIMENLPKKTLV